jgi:phosphatidylglycerophosphate synthase
VGFEPHDLEVMGLASTPGCSTALYNWVHREAFKGCCLYVVMKKTQKKKNENIWNVPNTLTFLRVVLTFITVYLIFAGVDIEIIVALFVIGMLTDFLDGQAARRLKQETEFGRKFDIMADRFLMVSVVLAIFINLTITGDLARGIVLQIMLVMSREIVSMPVSIIALSSRKPLPQAKFVGKLTTTLQGFAFPMILLGIYYPFFWFSMYVALLTGIVGLISAFVYINDVARSEEE